jgi:hypothetical protein
VCGVQASSNSVYGYADILMALVKVRGYGDREMLVVVLVANEQAKEFEAVVEGTAPCLAPRGLGAGRTVESRIEGSVSNMTTELSLGVCGD